MGFEVSKFFSFLLSSSSLLLSRLCHGTTASFLSAQPRAALLLSSPLSAAVAISALSFPHLRHSAAAVKMLSASSLPCQPLLPQIETAISRSLSITKSISLCFRFATPLLSQSAVATEQPLCAISPPPWWPGTHRLYAAAALARSEPRRHRHPSSLLIIQRCRCCPVDAAPPLYLLFHRCSVENASLSSLSPSNSWLGFSLLLKLIECKETWRRDDLYR